MPRPPSDVRDAFVAGPAGRLRHSAATALGACLALGAALLVGPACESKRAPAERAPQPEVIRLSAAELAGASPEAAPAEPTCGVQGMPDCPLQSWMDHQLTGPLSREEYPVLARGFLQLAAMAPDQFTGWSAWARGAAVAADRQDHEAIKKACRGCHEGYRERYRRTMRDRPVPQP